ncbi:MAG: shikimate kinase [Armatimonas sp.]
MPHNIVLIGFMGSGKSTVGKLVAELLGWKLVDTDALIVRLAGCSIPEQFAAEGGETAFRDRESQIVLGVSAGERQVIATGGGAPLREENAAALRGAGKVVWLTARPDIVVKRTAHRRTARPLLDTEEEPLTRVLRMMGERGPVYQRLAELVVDTSDRPPIAVAREIVRRSGLNATS